MIVGFGVALERFAQFGRHDVNGVNAVVTVYIYQQCGRGQNHSGVGMRLGVASS